MALRESLSVVRQKAEMEKLLKTPLKKGDSWFLLDIGWFKCWKKYVGKYDSRDTVNAGNQTDHPGPIDNSPLFRDRTMGDVNDTCSAQLKEHLVDQMNYVSIPEQAWIMMVAWYGLSRYQKPIERFVIEQGIFVKHCKVEVYLMDLNLCEHQDINTVITCQFSHGCTVGQLEQEMRRIFDVHELAEVRLWNRYMSGTYEPLNKKEITLQEADIYQGQVIVLEQRDSDGTWPRGGRSTAQANSQLPKKRNTKQVTTAEGTDLQCVICHKPYSQPKQLTCHHLACATCVLAWLQKRGRNQGCPLCGTPILDAILSPGCNLAALVAELPTDLGMAARVENQQALQGPHVCGMCPGTAASSYCLQCCFKLCDACTTYHHRLPASSGHTVENLSHLTAKKPPAPILPPPMCLSHGHESVELFCSTHQALLCSQCSSAHHRECKGVKTVTEAAQDKRTEFEQHFQTLGQKAVIASKQVQALKDTHLQTQKVFNCLQERLKRRHQEVSHQSQTSERQVDEARAAIVFHNAVLENLVHSADDHTLLTLLTKLDSAVTAIQQHADKVPEVPHKPDLKRVSQAQKQILINIDSLGK